MSNNLLVDELFFVGCTVNGDDRISGVVGNNAFNPCRIIEPELLGCIFGENFDNDVDSNERDNLRSDQF